MQTWIAASIVGACAAHVAWRVLLPGSVRRLLARRARRGAAPEGAGCSGCDAKDCALRSNTTR
jgi:hypothetical protein